MLKLKKVVLISVTLLSMSVITACGGGGDGNADGDDGGVDASMGGGADGATDGSTDGGTDGTADGSADGGTVDGSADGSTDGTVDGSADGSTDGTVDGSADGSTDGTVDGSADGGTDGTVDGSADGGTDGTVDGSADGGTDGTVDGSADGGTDGTVDGSADGGTDGTVDGSADGGSDGGTDGSTDGGGVVDAAATVVYAMSGPVAGTNDGVFTDLTTAAMSPSGDVCISASYNEDNTFLRGVWCGAPGAPQQILRTGDTFDNLPANISFESAEGLAFADNGNLLILADLAGASDGAALLLWDGQSVQSIVRTGELAPGFTDGSIVGTLDIARISNAGVVFQGTAGTIGLGLPVLWFWDGSDISVLTNFLGSAQPLAVDQNGCEISAGIGIISSAPVINNNGLIAFRGSLNDTPDTPDPDMCRGLAVTQTDGTTFTTIVRTGEIVPSTATAVYSALSLNELFDSGAMSITATLEDDNASGLDTGRISTWIFRPDGSADLVTIVEETVPPGFVERISLLSNVPIVLASSETLAVQLTQTSLGVSVLAGPPHTGNPYPDIGAVGATTMSLIASTNSDAPEGFAADSFLSAFSRPAIDGSGRIYYRATVEVPSENASVDAFYTAMAGLQPTRVLEEGSVVEYNGETRTIDDITFADANALSFLFNNLQGVAISEQGDALVPVRLDGFTEALIYVSM